MNMKKSAVFVLILVLAILSACVTRPDEPLPVRHPADAGVGTSPRCSDCHEPPLTIYDHNSGFATEHRSQARQNAQLCNMCHENAFCSDCHALRSELNPSVKLEAETYRNLPHQGDYRIRHRIDGRIDPTSCYRCHGNPKNSRSCNICHG